MPGYIIIYARAEKRKGRTCRSQNRGHPVLLRHDLADERDGLRVKGRQHAAIYAGALANSRLGSSHLNLVRE